VEKILADSSFEFQNVEKRLSGLMKNENAIINEIERTEMLRIDDRRRKKCKGKRRFATNSTHFFP